jgi:hypothetical protein
MKLLLRLGGCCSYRHYFGWFAVEATSNPQIQIRELPKAHSMRGEKQILEERLSFL